MHDSIVVDQTFLVQGVINFERGIVKTKVQALTGYNR